jgi:signal transduction histidine kinase
VIAVLELSGWAAAGITAGCAWLSQRRYARRLEQVARASHELRGPLTATRLGLELGVRVGEISLSRLGALAQELERATFALADLSAAMGGRSTGLRLERLELGGVVSDCVEGLRAAAAKRGAELRLSWPAGEVLVLGDRLRLAQTVSNLLGNAIEHGGGLVEVCGRLEGNSVRVEMTDDGPGLPAPVAELAARPRAGRGSRGRGLAIASSIARDHGGRVAAAPSHWGARVVLELPLRSRSKLSRSA